MFETLLSVIIPVYNVEPYLEQCLDSVINQTYKNMEIICINDGSTDNSLEILEKYKLKDARIKIISQENKGLSEARNLGLKIAKGKYIGFVDSDDYLEPNMYEKLVVPMIKDPSIDFSATGIWIEDSSRSPKRQILPLSGKNQAFMNLMVAYGFVWNKVYKSEIIKKKEIDSPKGIYYEDCAFSFAYLVHSKYAYYIEDSLYHYRKRKNSICESIKHIEHMHRRIDKIKSCLYFYEYLKRFGLSKRYKKYVYIQINEHIKFILKQANLTKGNTLRVKCALAKQIFEIGKRNDFSLCEKLSFWISFAKNLF